MHNKTKSKGHVHSGGNFLEYFSVFISEFKCAVQCK